MVRRIYVEKKPGLRQEARGLLHELQTVVGVSALEDTFLKMLSVSLKELLYFFHDIYIHNHFL